MMGKTILETSVDQDAAAQRSWVTCSRSCSKKGSLSTGCHSPGWGTISWSPPRGSPCPLTVSLLLVGPLASLLPCPVMRTTVLVLECPSASHAWRGGHPRVKFLVPPTSFRCWPCGPVPHASGSWWQESHGVTSLA